MQATIPDGPGYELRDGRQPASARAGRQAGEDWAGTHRAGKSVSGSAEALPGAGGMGWGDPDLGRDGSGLARGYPWLATMAGLFAGVALSGFALGGAAAWAAVGSGVLACAAAGGVLGRMRSCRDRERVHWAAQVGRLFQAMGKSDDGVVVLDGRTRVQWVGPAFCRILGRSADEVVGRPMNLRDLVGPGTDVEEKCRAAVLAGSIWRGEVVSPGPNGLARSAEQWVMGVWGWDGGLEHYVGVRRDTHASGRSMEELAKANESMENQLLQVTSEFGQFKRELEMMAFALGHQLRSAQIGLTEMKVALGMERPELIPANVRREVEWMMRSGSRMMRLVDSLTWLHELKRRPLELERVDLSATASEILDGFSEADPGRSIRLEIEPRLTVIGDGRLLRVMLNNLLGNAWKYSRGNPNARIEFGSVVRSGRPRTFFVRDNGVGFDRSWVSRVLRGADVSGFLEASSDARLGLVVVQRIVARHRGEIWAETHSGGGAVFHYTLGEAQVGGRERVRTPG